jgi:hypothetical protein
LFAFFYIKPNFHLSFYLIVIVLPACWAIYKAVFLPSSQ